LRRIVRRIRTHWPATRLTIRGDSHYGRPEAMVWCEKHRIDYLFGLAGNKALQRRVEDDADPIRIEATPQGLDIRYVVTNLEAPKPDELYATLYRARGQAENLIKLHKTQLKSDRTSCRSPLANQMRLVLHTAAYWLMLGVRDAIPKTHALAKAEFATIRARLLKLGPRIVETVHRVRIAFAAACPDARLIRDIALALKPAPA
jgi:hypothetical protein